MVSIYTLGNDLRGTFSGEFETDDEAWSILSEKFNNSFPSYIGRQVHMTKVVKYGRTRGGNETDADRKLRLMLEKEFHE